MASQWNNIFIIIDVTKDNGAADADVDADADAVSLIEIEIDQGVIVEVSR